MAEVAHQTKALIWDLDGTILDSFGIFTSLMTEIAPAFNLPAPTEQNLLDNYHGALTESIHNGLGGVLPQEQLDKFVEQFLNKQTDHYLAVEDHLLEDALDLSQRASQKGLKQAIVTNRDHAGRGNASPRSIIASTVLKDHIHEVICGDEANGFRKPEPQVMGNLLDRWGIAHNQVTVIGDQHVDAQLALNLGAKAIIVCRDGAEFAHAHTLDKNWQDHVTVVQSLKDVTI